MKTVIYARVSTLDQNTMNQTEVLKAWANQLPLPNLMGISSGGVATNPEENEVVAIYAEQESAWKEGHQHELARLLQDAQKGQFKAVLVWALDRLSRQGVRAILELIHKLSRYGVRVYSYQESWTLTPSSELYELLIALSGWVANYESKRRSERTKAGMARARKEGKQIGRPKGSKDKNHRRRLGYLLRGASAKEREKYGGK